MKFKHVIEFAKKANYGKDVMVFPGYKILEYMYSQGLIAQGGEEVISELEKYEDDELWCAAIPLISKDTEDFVKFIICVGIEFHKLHKNREDTYKFVLLHEIGHIYTYHEGVFDSEDEEAMWELEAQLWAIKRAEEMGLKRVRKKAWENFQKWDTMDDPYKRAKEIYEKGL